jgi:hypothetical protein
MVAQGVDVAVGFDKSFSHCKLIIN